MSEDNIVIGIDLGTTYTCAAVHHNGTVEVIPEKMGTRTMSSIVAFTERECLVGEVARKQALRNLSNTVFDAKRLIGRPYNDPFVQKDKDRLPFQVVDVEGKAQVRVQFKGKTQDMLPQQISAHVLAQVKANAEAFLGGEVKDAVITVPAHFNNVQRQATMDAGRIAGLNVLRIISEPTAAAVAYGFNKHFSNNQERRAPAGDNSKPIYVLVYDLGGGTFDVSVLQIEGTIFDVLATAGDTHLGGNNFDDLLVDYFVQTFVRVNYSDCTGDMREEKVRQVRDNMKAMQRLRLKCEEAKRDLSAAEETQLYLDVFFGGVDLNSTITRTRFEHLCDDLFQQTLTHVENALRDARLTKDQIDHFVLVGGSTRIPRIQAMLQEFFGEGKKLKRDISPDEAVAYGAAIQASLLAGGAGGPSSVEPRIEINDATNLSLGIETEGGVMLVMIPKNEKLPARATKSFTTVKDFQTTVMFSIFQGERPLTRDNFPLGDFSLANIAPAPKGQPDFLVTFEVDVNCVLKVTALDQRTKQSKQVVISDQQFKLSNADIDRMLKEAAANRTNDAKQKDKVVARTSLERYLRDTEVAAKQKTDLNADNRARILAKIEETLEWIDSNAANEAAVFRQRQNELTQSFASLMI